MITVSERTADAGRLVSERTAATYCDVSTGAMRRWRSKKIGPPFFRLGKLIRYRMADIEQWLAGRRG